MVEKSIEEYTPAETARSRTGFFECGCPSQGGDGVRYQVNSPLKGELLAIFSVWVEEDRVRSSHSPSSGITDDEGVIDLQVETSHVLKRVDSRCLWLRDNPNAAHVTHPSAFSTEKGCILGSFGPNGWHSDDVLSRQASHDGAAIVLFDNGVHMLSKKREISCDDVFTFFTV